MSHPALAMIADWLNDDSSDYGLNALLQTVPVFGDDDVPAKPTVYDQYRDDWVATGDLPKSDDELARIATPLVAVRLDRVDNTRVPYSTTAATRAKDSELRVVIVIAMRGTSPAANGRALGYYSRVVEDSLWALSFSDNTARLVPATGMRLGKIQAITRTGLQAPIRDLTAVTSVSATFAITEATPVSLTI